MIQTLKFLLTGFVFIIFATIGASSVNAYSCLNVDVSFPPIENFSAENIEVGCKGGQDFGLEVPACRGSKSPISPGGDASLTGCDCEFVNKYYLENVPDNCDLTVSGGSRGQNGLTTTAVITGSCREKEKPKVSEPTPEERPKDVCPADRRCEYQEVCTSKGKEGMRTCKGLENESGACEYNDMCSADCGECKVSDSKPRDDDDDKKDDDDDKDDKNPGGGEIPGPNEQPKIINTPSPAQTPGPGSSAAPAKSPAPSESPNRTPGPSAQASSKPSAGPQSSPPPAEFSSAMCKCDGIESTPLLPGQLATFTVYGKVEGADTTKAIIENMTFYMGKSIGSSTQASIIGSPVTVAATPIGGGTGKVRYKATWRQTLPNIVDSNATYRVWAQIKCNKKTTAMGGQTLVMGTQSQNSSSFGQVLGWFDSIFSSNKVVTTPAPKSNVSPTNNPLASAVAPDSLQLKVLKPAVVEKSACSLMTFKFSE